MKQFVYLLVFFAVLSLVAQVLSQPTVPASALSLASVTTECSYASYGEFFTCTTVTLCDPNDPTQYSYYASEYKVSISAMPDKVIYYVGDSVRINGTVKLQEQKVYYNHYCGKFEYGPWMNDAVAYVHVTVNPPGQVITPKSDGSFVVTETLPSAPSTYVYTLVATHSISGQTARTTVSVTALPRPDFTLSASPTLATVEYGQTASLMISVQSKNNFHESVKLSVAPTVQGMTASLSPVQGIPDYSSVLSVTVDKTVPAGTYVLNLVGSGTSSSTQHSLSLTIKVVPDFDVKLTIPSVTVTQGSSNSTMIALSSLHGFNSTVRVTSSWVGAQPSGITVSFNASQTMRSGQEVHVPMRISALSNATVGQFTLMISVGIVGQGGQTLSISQAQVTHDATVSVSVRAGPPDFTLAYVAVAGGVAASAAATTTHQVLKKRKQSRRGVVWTVTAPYKIRKGGRTLAHSTLTNNGNLPVANATINMVGQGDLQVSPILRVEPVMPNQTKYQVIRVGAPRSASTGKKKLILTLNTGQGAPQPRTLFFSVESLKVGLLLDAHNQAYIQRISSTQSVAFKLWLEQNQYEFETIMECGLGALKKCNVVLAPNQFALTHGEIDALRTYTVTGGGVIALGSIGIVDPDRFLATGDTSSAGHRLVDILGYASGETAHVEKCQGLRLLPGPHPMIREEKGGPVGSIQHTGPVYMGQATGTLIAEQRVQIRGRGVAVVPAVIANQRGSGRIVHFNMNLAESVHLVDSLLEKAINWAAHFT